MKLSLAAALGLFPLLAATASFAEIPAADANAKSLAAAEIAFAQESVAKGTRAAFLNVLSDESIAFLPGPQNGRRGWEARKESGSRLEWQPVLAVVAASGDFGYTTGPWTFKKNATDKDPAGFGQFVSIWRRETGKWKLLFDLGSDNPAPTAPVPALQLQEGHAPNGSTPGTRANLLEVDRNYGTGRVKNFSALAADDVRLYLPDRFPLIGKAAAAALEQAPAAITLREPKGEAARSGDLGFAWGEYAADGAAEVSGYYLHIWRKNEEGEWKLALDLVHPR